MTNPVSDNSSQQPAAPFQPTRKPFQQEVDDACAQLVTTLLPNVPELQGIAFAFIWDPDIRAEGFDFARILGRNTESPRFKLRALEQIQRLLSWEVKNFHADLLKADQIAQQLNDELHAKRKELDALNAAIAERRGAARHSEPG